MTTAIALQLMLILLFVIGLVLWIDEWPHQRRGYENHDGCDICIDTEDQR